MFISPLTDVVYRLRRKLVRGPPVLRRSVPAKMTHGEAMRLVNRSSQILVATVGAMKKNYCCEKN